MGAKAADEERGATAVRKGETAVEKGERGGSGASGDEDKGDTAEGKRKLSEDAVLKLSEEVEWKWKIATSADGEEEPTPRRERRRWRSARREPVAAADKEEEVTAAAKKVAVEKPVFFFSAAAAATGKMINLVSSEGKPFKMSEEAARLSAVLADMIDHGCAGGNIPLPNVNARALATVIKYCDEHAAAAKPSSGSHHGAADGAGSSSSSVNTAASEKTLAEWDRKLVDDLTQDALYDLIVAANFLNIKGLLEATCQKVADMIKGKTPAQIRSIFNIANDFTAEQEAEFRKETPWDFED